MYVKNSPVSVKYKKRCTQKKTGSFFLPHGVLHKLLALFWYVCLLQLAISMHVCLAQNAANSIFPLILGSFFSNCIVLHGDIIFISNRSSNNSVISVPSWHVCLFWFRKRQPPCLSLLKDGWFQFSTFGSAGNVYSKLQSTKTAK